MQQTSKYTSKNKYSRVNMSDKKGGQASGEGVQGIEGAATLEGDGRTSRASGVDANYSAPAAAAKKRFSVSPSDMRRAVLMSEILGRPAALRGVPGKRR